MLHSFLVCTPDGVLRLAHYFLEGAAEEHEVFEKAIAERTISSWEAATRAALIVDVVDGLHTLIHTANSLVYIVSAISDSMDDVQLFEDAEFLARLTTMACDGDALGRLPEADFHAKSIVALEEAVHGGIIIYRHIENILRIAKLKQPKNG